MKLLILLGLITGFSVDYPREYRIENTHEVNITDINAYHLKEQKRIRKEEEALKEKQQKEHDELVKYVREGAKDQASKTSNRQTSNTQKSTQASYELFDEAYQGKYVFSDEIDLEQLRSEYLKRMERFGEVDPIDDMSEGAYTGYKRGAPKTEEELKRLKERREQREAEEKKRKEQEDKKLETHDPLSSKEDKESEALYTLNEFLVKGVVNWGGYKYTYYSQSVLPGGGLIIPGRHVSSEGYVSDKDGYIVLAGDHPLGSVFPTPFGKDGKIYDRGTFGNHLDVYIK